MSLTYYGNWTGRTIELPIAPPLEIQPRSKRAVVTVAAGASGKSLLDLTGEHLRAYAARLGADFVVLDWPGDPRLRLSSKFAIWRALEHYDRIAYLDADILCRPDCIDVFSLCAENEFGFADELPYHRMRPEFKCEPEYAAFAKDYLPAEVAGIPWMLNSGVMVVPRSHLEVLRPPRHIKVSRFSEQNYFGTSLRASRLPYRLLDRRANWQKWTDPGFKCAPPDAILHWSGDTDRFRLPEIFEWVRRYPLPPPPFELGPRPHSASVDRRHALWLYETLMTGRFRKVLEIGCFQGYSTEVFLAAARAKRVDEVWLCDPTPQQKLHDLLDRYKLGEIIHFHTMRSTDFLRTVGPFDLVFVDGDHVTEYVDEETRLLLDRKHRAIFAHDTSSNLPLCEGPKYLKAALQSAGYLCIEDCLPREGELTERGMLFAARDRRVYEAGLEAYRKCCC